MATFATVTTRHCQYPFCEQDEFNDYIVDVENRPLCQNHRVEVEETAKINAYLASLGRDLLPVR